MSQTQVVDLTNPIKLFNETVENKLGRLNSRALRWDYIFNKVPTLKLHYNPDDYKDVQDCYYKLNLGIKEYPKCPICKINHLKPYKDTSGKFLLSSYCSIACSNSDFETRSEISKKIQSKVDQKTADTKRKQTMLKKYGHEYNGQRENVKETLRQSKLSDEHFSLMSNKDWFEEQNSFKFWIKDYEWTDPNKKEVLKSYILHAAGITPNRIYARDTEVRVFSNADVKKFQVANCFYGFRAASLNLGLVLKKDKGDLKKGTLLMVTTFGKNFFGKKEGLVEVFRVGTLRNTQVIGGASKLFQHFVRNYPYLEIGGKPNPYSKIVYYVDYDHGAGKSLERVGFTYVRDSGGGFMNVDVTTGLASHRKPMQHKEVMKQVAQGLVIAVPNAGVKVYEFVPDDHEDLKEIRSKPLVHGLDSFVEA